MKITMKQLSASPAGALEAGRTYDLPPARSRSLIDAGVAVPVDAPRPRRVSGAAEESGGKDTDVPLEKRTIDQLKVYAAERGIDLGDAAKKAEILEAIVTTEQRREEEADDDPDDSQ